jgi:hypothetical protein
MTKYKSKALYNEISSKLKTSKNKLKIMETNLEFLKSKTYDSHMNDIITLEQNTKDAYEIKLKQLYSGQKVNVSLQNICFSIGKIERFGIESNVKMVHINLISILFSINTLNVMNKNWKTEGRVG